MLWSPVHCTHLSPFFLPLLSLLLMVKVKYGYMGWVRSWAAFWMCFFKKCGNMQVSSSRGLDWAVKPGTNKLREFEL